MDAPIRVLHIDDEPGFADLTALNLRRENDQIECDTALSADSALDRLAADEYDCIIADYDMPRTNGIEVLEAVREQYPDLPFILFTGKGSEDAASEAISSGVTHYLQKGGTKMYEVLAERIEHAVEDYWATTQPDSAESAISHAERRYARILKHSSDYVLIVDADAQVTYASPAVERVAGYDPEELLGENALEYVHPDDIEEAAAAFASVVDGPNEEVTIEYRALDSDGSWRWIEARGRNYLGDPVIEGVLVNVRDITQIKQREEALREEQAFIEQSLNALEDVFFVIDPDGRLIRWNDPARQWTGYTDDELAELHATDLISEDNREEVRESIDRMLESGSATIQVDVLTKDGERIPTEFNGVRLTDPDDDLIGLAGIGRDITERQAREEQLERYETILKALGDPVYTLDAEGTFTFVNEAFLDVSGYEQEELLGARASLVFAEEGERRGAELAQQLLENGDKRRRTWELALQTRGGDRIPHENHMALLPFGENGSFRGTAGVIRDISKRKERERELERQNERLAEFAGILSHDLRTPLNIASGQLALAREEHESEYLDDALRALDEMETLIDHLMTITRSGESASSVERVALHELSEICWRNVHADEATLTVDTEQVVLADRTRLRQLLENLMRNAIEHVGEDVEVRIGELRDTPGFFLEDDGPGIPAEHRDRVFQRGYTSKDGGLGLGLGIVNEVAEAHEWELRLRESEDGGARFEFTGATLARDGTPPDARPQSGGE